MQRRAICYFVSERFSAIDICRVFTPATSNNINNNICSVRQSQSSIISSNTIRSSNQCDCVWRWRCTITTRDSDIVQQHGFRFACARDAVTSRSPAGYDTVRAYVTSLALSTCPQAAVCANVLPIALHWRSIVNSIVFRYVCRVRWCNIALRLAHFI